MDGTRWASGCSRSALVGTSLIPALDVGRLDSVREARRFHEKSPVVAPGKFQNLFCESQELGCSEIERRSIRDKGLTL